MSINDITNDYRRSLRKYELFSQRIEGLITDLTSINEVKVHFTESRAKTIGSLLEKLRKPGKSYERLSEIPDLAGVRVVLYYQDDVEKVSEIIEGEFTVLKNETDNNEKYSPDQFGYLSKHYVVSLNKKRADLPEWIQLKEIHAEVQIRTVLQHSWAAASHVLQYKREGDIPRLLRRKLHRLAGLFELADEQFVEIRNERNKIREEKPVSKEKMSKQLVDSLSIKQYMEKSKNFNNFLDEMRRNKFLFPDDPSYIRRYTEEGIEEDEQEYIGVVVEELERLGLNEISSLDDVLIEDHQEFLSKVCNDHEWHVNDSFAFFLLVIASFPKSFTVDYLVNKRQWGNDIAQRVVNGVSKILKGKK